MRLLELLKRIEWREGHYGSECAECDHLQIQGHKDGCELKAAIDYLEALERGSSAPVRWVDREELEKMYPQKQASEAGEPRIVEAFFNPLDHEGMK